MPTREELVEQVKGMTEDEASRARIVVVPEWPSGGTSVEAILERGGAEPLSPEEFERHFGHLPSDGEG